MLRLISYIFCIIMICHYIFSDIVDPLECEFCKKRFANTGNKGKHVKMKHFGIRFTCVVCNKKLASRFNLERHKKQHIGQSIHERDPLARQQQQQLQQLQILQQTQWRQQHW